MILRPLAFLANIYQVESLAAVHLGFDLIDGQFAHARFGILDDFQETGRMLVCHRSTAVLTTIPSRAGRAAHREVVGEGGPPRQSPGRVASFAALWCISPSCPSCPDSS